MIIIPGTVSFLPIDINNSLDRTILLSRDGIDKVENEGLRNIDSNRNLAICCRREYVDSGHERWNNSGTLLRCFWGEIFERRRNERGTSCPRRCYPRWRSISRRTLNTVRADVNRSAIGHLQKFDRGQRDASRCSPTERQKVPLLFPDRKKNRPGFRSWSFYWREF